MNRNKHSVESNIVQKQTQCRDKHSVETACLGMKTKCQNQTEKTKKEKTDK